MTDGTATTDQGLLARAIGVLVSPGKTFAGVARSPRPAGILLLVCLLTGLATGLPQFTERGRQAALDMQVQQIERFTGQPVTPEMYTQMEGRTKYSAYASLIGVFVVLPVVCLLFTTLFWVLFNALLGGTASFKQVLAVVTHSQVVTAAGTLLAAPIQYAQGTFTTAGPFNLGALVPMLEPGNPIAAVLGAISFFTLWQLIVTGIGLGTLYRRRPLPIAAGLIVFYVLIITAVTVVFSRVLGR